MQDRPLVDAVLEDHRTAPITPTEKALLAFVEKVNAKAQAIEPSDVEAVLAAGWTQEAVYDAIAVCALFNFYNRWLDACGIRQQTAEAYRHTGARLSRRGYLVTGS